MSDTNGKTQEPAKEGKDKKATQTRDPELKAMAKASRIMDDLTADQRLRLATWLYHRYVATPANNFFNGLKADMATQLRAMESR